MAVRGAQYMGFMIHIKCPHCGMQGRMLVRDLGAILLGPCPVCHELVLVFSGQTFPLDTKSFEAADLSAKKEYLEEILHDFIQENLRRFFALSEKQALPNVPYEEAIDNPQGVPGSDQSGPDTITDSELERFVSEELRALDNPQYFKKIFG